MESGAKDHESGNRVLQNDKSESTKFRYDTANRRIKRVQHMFMGEFEHCVDAKGRIIIPAKFREDLGDEFVITLGLDGCLFAYPKNEWEAFTEEIKKVPGTKEARQMIRWFSGNAAACEVDKQGRILIPVQLRERAGLIKDIVFVGVLNRIEIWSKERWEKNNDYDNVDAIAEHMTQFGISF